MNIIHFLFATTFSLSHIVILLHIISRINGSKILHQHYGLISSLLLTLCAAITYIGTIVITAPMFIFSMMICGDLAGLQQKLKRRIITNTRTRVMFTSRVVHIIAVISGVTSYAYFVYHWALTLYY